MEYRDTIQKGIWTTELQTYKDSIDNQEFRNLIENVRIEQAEVSFKAGIKEVVDWINNSDSSCQEYFSKVCFDNNDWRSKLKEWGVE